MAEEGINARRCRPRCSPPSRRCPAWLADGVLQGYAQMEDPKTGDAIGGTGPPTIGLNWATTSAGLELRSGSRPQGPDEVAVDAGTARKFDITVGETIRILFQGPSREFRVVGIAE